MTITEITWGDPIDAANNGKPLPWLKEDERVKCYWGSVGRYEGMETWVHCVSGWTTGFQIRLPADHDYYRAVARGFTYWPGGDSAPDDWDGGDVLLENGALCPQPGTWAHGVDRDIIGYRNRSELAQNDDDYVRVKRVTITEFRDTIWSQNQSYDGVGHALGIIYDETPLEQFEREHGGLDNNQRDIIEVFIEWQNNHG